jgi:cobalt-zinc-cadmium efflux system protein
MGRDAAPASQETPAPMSATHLDQHGHRHVHGHRHGHPHHRAAGADYGRAFAIGIGLNILFVAAEAAFGIVSGSMALLADAGHNLSDVLGLAVAWVATVLARLKASDRFTYGLKGSSIMAALFNAVFLLFAVAIVGVEAAQRLAAPQPVDEPVVIAVALAGLVVNGATALLFASGRKADLNIKGAFLHMAADAAISAGVAIAALVSLETGWRWLDPVVSLAIVAVIVAGTWGLLRDAVFMSLAGVPASIDHAGVRHFLGEQEGVAKVHDLHIWPVSTTEVALTVHLVMPGGFPGDGFVGAVSDALRDRYGIPHTTIQIEVGDHPVCTVSPEQSC